MKIKWKAISLCSSCHSLLPSLLLQLICSPGPFPVSSCRQAHHTTALPKSSRAPCSWAPGAGQRVVGKTGNRDKKCILGDWWRWSNSTNKVSVPSPRWHMALAKWAVVPLKSMDRLQWDGVALALSQKPTVPPTPTVYWHCDRNSAAQKAFC